VIISYWVGPTTTLVWIVDGGGHVGNAFDPHLGAAPGLVDRSDVGGDRRRQLAGNETRSGWRYAADIARRRDDCGGSHADARVARAPRPCWSGHPAVSPPRTRQSVDDRAAWAVVPLVIRSAPRRSGQVLDRAIPAALRPSAGSLLYLESRSSDADAPIAISPRRRSRRARELDEGGAATAARRGARGRRDCETLPRGTATVLTGGARHGGPRRHLAGSHEVLHLATHAVLRDDRPFDSFLALAVAGRDAATDGRLTTADIYGLDLNADLVVLSACQSARGPVTGDGVLG